MRIGVRISKTGQFKFPFRFQLSLHLCCTPLDAFHHLVQIRVTSKMTYLIYTGLVKNIVLYHNFEEQDLTLNQYRRLSLGKQQDEYTSRECL